MDEGYEGYEGYEGQEEAKEARRLESERDVVEGKTNAKRGRTDGEALGSYPFG